MVQLPVRPWWIDVIRGILGLGFAALLVTLHVHLFFALFRFIGVYLLADGVVDIADLISGRRTSRRFRLDILLSLASSVIGLLCVFVPQVTALVLVNLVAARIVIQGVSILRTAWRAQDRTAGASWLFGGALIVGGVAFALLAMFTFALIVLSIFIYAAAGGAFLLLRGLMIRFAPQHYLARTRPPVTSASDLLPTLPPTTRRALVFIRRAGASGLGHVAWAFEWGNGWFTAGSVENRAGKPVAPPDAMDFWATHTLDPIATAQEQLFPYDEYKLFYVEQPQPKIAWKTVVWESRTPYVVVRHNCSDVVYEVLRSYGVITLYDPAEEYVPNDWYDALDGPSFAILRQPSIPIHLHRASQRALPLHEQTLTIPATVEGLAPPWRQQGHRAWQELRLVMGKMGLDVRLLLSRKNQRSVMVPAIVSADAVQSPQASVPMHH